MNFNMNYNDDSWDVEQFLKSFENREKNNNV